MKKLLTFSFYDFGNSVFPMIIITTLTSSYFVNPEEQLVVVYFTQVVPISLDDHQKLKALVYQSIVD